MELEATNQKKKNPSQPKPDGLTQRQKMEKEAPNKKKQKKIHHSLNPTKLNQRQ